MTNEQTRLAAVSRYIILESDKQHELQDIVELAADICKMPSAMISLIDEQSMYLKYKAGLDLEMVNCNETFFSHTILQHDITHVPDALNDKRFSHNPFVTGSPNIRFYAGAPVSTTDGIILGALSVVDIHPRKLMPRQLQMLKLLAKQVVNVLEFDTSLSFIKQEFVEAVNSENKLRSLFNSSSSVHLLIGKQLEVLDYNHAAADFIGKINEINIERGMKVSEFVNFQDLPNFIDSYYLALAGTASDREAKLQYGAEEIYWYLTYSPARNLDGEIIGVSYNATDITKRVAQELKVLTQYESLKEIAYIQSHEMRKPVASILGLIAILKSDDHASSEEALILLEQAALDLDKKIRTIVSYAV